MKQKHRKLFRSAVSLLLVVIMSFNTIVCSYASGPVATQGGGTLEITTNAIIIDGVSYTKAQFSQAIRQMQQMPDSPERTAIYNATGVATTRSVTVALFAVGSGIAYTFLKISFALVMAGLVTYCAHRVFVIAKDTLPGLTRDIRVVIKDAESVFIDGVRVGINWATYEIVDYIDKNRDSISYTMTIEEELEDVLGNFGDLQCVPAKKAAVAVLEERKQQYEIVSITYLSSAKMVSVIHNEKVVSENGYHVGVLYSGNVYCNVHPYGLPLAVWLNDFVCSGYGIVDPSIYQSLKVVHNFGQLD